MKGHYTEKALKCFDKSLQLHMDGAVDAIKDQMKMWRAHCRYQRIEPYHIYLGVPTKRAFITYYSGKKGIIFSSGKESDFGTVSGNHYGPRMPEGDKKVN
ncbi:hypothetical protein Dsin_000577 [Dipteronia sinensis]|uniref:Uncharacterized protein n=1 Tax=Dipteronia sinensis TaxID=43782 RepID=A0AAE0EHN0_9ROSI|nr:hypothetical protein Dsin_000577 [Dipteronia sinensis]